ncbi:MAG: tetratricopeptide repeat protein [Ignavibacteria bacterium]|nr:tetratricopeptide repeat protein [Ignavibacteria bacterium]
MNNQIKKYSPIIISLFLISFMVYISGCSSAESTTGKLAFKTGDYEKAERELLKGLKIDNKDDEGWYMLGVSQIELKKYDDGAKSLKTSLSISKSYANDISDYWIIKFNEGAKWFKAGVEAEKNHDSVRIVDNFTKALDYFLAASYVIPDSLQSLKAIGECYLALGQRDKAMEVYTTILEKSKSESVAIKVAAILFDAGLSAINYSNSLDIEIGKLSSKLAEENLSEDEKNKIITSMDVLNEKSLNSFKNAAGTFDKILNIQFLPKDNTYYETSAYDYALSKAKIGEKVRMKNPEGQEHKPIFAEALVVLEPLAESITKDRNLELKIQCYELLVAVYANLGENDKAVNALKIKDELAKELENEKP